MRKHICILFVLLMSLPIFSQSNDFTLGASVGFSFNGVNNFGNVDINMVGQHEQYIIPLGVITDTHRMGNGWGFRTGFGMEFCNLGFLATVTIIDLNHNDTRFSYGFNGFCNVHDKLSVMVGTETIRGIRVGLIYR